jgi:hypothetical protein
VAIPEGERSLPYGEVVELVECRLKQANELLAQGYTLLGIYAVSGPGVHQETKSFYTRRTIVYVLGRPTPLRRDLSPWHRSRLTGRTVVWL